MNEKAIAMLLTAFAAVSVAVLLTTPSRVPSGAEPGAVESTVPGTVPTGDAMSMVEEILNRRSLDETAVTHCIYDDSLHRSRKLTGVGNASPSHALAQLSGDRKMNPIAAFWVLTEEGLYRKTPEYSDKLAVPAMKTPETGKKEYPYTTEGVRDFLTDVLNLSAAIEDGLPLDVRVLGKDKAVEQTQVYLEQEDCYYTYYICYSPEAAHYLCFYLRGTETITDAEFQLLNLRYADGDTESLLRLDQVGDRQAAALMAAAELLLTGESRAAQGRIPLSYELGGYQATIERFNIIGSGDTGILTNYRIRK